ncbi:hypothetical protein D3C85_881080 [compost metagenome]
MGSLQQRLKSRSGHRTAALVGLQQLGAEFGLPLPHANLSLAPLVIFAWRFWRQVVWGCNRVDNSSRFASNDERIPVEQRVDVPRLNIESPLRNCRRGVSKLVLRAHVSKIKDQAQRATCIVRVRHRRFEGFRTLYLFEQPSALSISQTGSTEFLSQLSSVRAYVTVIHDSSFALSEILVPHTQNVTFLRAPERPVVAEIRIGLRHGIGPIIHVTPGPHIYARSPDEVHDVSLRCRSERFDQRRRRNIKPVELNGAVRDLHCRLPTCCLPGVRP